MAHSLDGQCQDGISSHKGLFSYELSKVIRPQESINNLINKLYPYAEKIEFPSNHVYILSYPNRESMVLLLLSGGLRYYAKKINSTNDGILLGTVFSPHVCGLVDSCVEHCNDKSMTSHYVVAEKSCKAYVLPADRFSELADKYDLWYDISNILAYRLLVLSERKFELEGCDAYKKIRHLLSELWEYPNEVRENINVLSFIRTRALISRSQILKILSELRFGDYIEIHNGRLLLMKNKLPESY